MTDMIARDLQEISTRPFHAGLAALFTLLIVLVCAIGCGALLAVVANLGVLL